MAYNFNLDGGAALMNFGAADQFKTALTKLRLLDQNIRDTESHVTERRQTLTQQALANAREGNGELDALCAALTPWLPTDRFRS